MAEAMEIFSENLKALRKERGWSQGELARRAKVSPQLIFALESKRTWPSRRSLEQLASALEVTETRLFADKSLLVPEDVLRIIAGALGYDLPVILKKS